MLLFLLFGVTCALVCLLWWCQWSRQVDPKIPELKGAVPLLGHSLIVLGNSEELMELGRRVSRETNELGGVAVAWMGPFPYYVITDPGIALKVSNSCLQKLYVYRFASTWIGEGLLTAFESTWRRHRKLLSPTFNQHVLDGFLGIFNIQAELLTDKLEEHSGKGPFDHWPILADNALETICKTAFGLNCSRDDVIDKEYRDAISCILDIFTRRFMKFWLHSDWVYGLTNHKKQEDAVVNVLKKVSYNIIQQKKSEINDETTVKNVSEEFRGLNFKSFLDMLMALGSEGLLTDQEIREEVDGMIVAAHDTSSATIMYTLTVLGSYPDVQQKVYNEIINVIGPGDRPVTKEDLPKLVYLDAVINESMRLYPVGPFMGRTAEEDVVIDGYKFPKGSSIVLSVWGIHRNKIWGPDAEKYRPERWLEDNFRLQPGAFAAFGIGRRGCIGKVYAMMAIKIILCYILSRYSVSADHTKMRTKFVALFKPVSGHYIAIEKRKA